MDSRMQTRAIHFRLRETQPFFAKPNCGGRRTHQTTLILNRWYRASRLGLGKQAWSCRATHTGAPPLR